MDANPPKDAGPSPFPPVPGTLDRALALVEYLREHCPWDREQTAVSLLPHLLEETHETVDAVRSGDPAALREELGDLLLNVAFQVVVAEQSGHFTREEVVGLLEEKMIRRHPHLFGGEPGDWEAIKARERRAREVGARKRGPGESSADGLPSGLDPLHRALRVQERAAGVGFDWDHPAGALAKVREELAEVEGASQGSDPVALEEEFGDLLFAVVNYARLSGVHPLTSLERANAKFLRRFRAVEALAGERGLPLPGTELAELDALWDEVKRAEVARAEVERSDVEREKGS
jgi:MazG family protein